MHQKAIFYFHTSFPVTLLFNVNSRNDIAISKAVGEKEEEAHFCLLIMKGHSSGRFEDQSDRLQVSFSGCAVQVTQLSLAPSGRSPILQSCKDGRRWQGTRF